MSRLKPFKTFFFLLLLLSFFLQACGTSPTPTAESNQGAVQTEAAVMTEEPEAPAEMVKVKVVTLPFITFAPYFIALEEGYFADEGLDVELVDMRVQEEILPALSSGQVDVSSGLLSAGMLNAIARGGNIKITADKGVVDPEGCINWAIVGRKDLVEAGEMETPDQLKGQTVNIVPATWLEFYLAKVLEMGGLTLDDIEKVNLSAQSSPEAFNQKQIAAAANSEPWITRFKASGHVPVFALPQEILPDASAAVMVYGPTLLGDNAEIGVRFMKAYLRGVRKYNEGKTEQNMATIADFSQLDPELLQEMCWPAIRPSGEVNVDSVLDFQTWSIEAGYQENPVTAEQFYDGSFVEAANQALDEGQ